MYFLLLAAFSGRVGAGFPWLKTAASAAGVRCSLPALPVIVVQLWSSPRLSVDLSSNPAHGGKQQSWYSRTQRGQKGD